MSQAAFVANWMLRYLLPITLFAFLVGVTYFTLETTQTKKVLEKSEPEEIEQLKTTCELSLQAAVSDLRFLTEQTTSALAGSPAGSLPASLGKEFLAFFRSKPNYDQIRYIDRDGSELVRVNRQGNDAELVPLGRLPQKARHYYVRDALKLGPGEVYISPLDLNIENGRIEVPRKPMIRFGMAVFGADSRVRGVVVLNYLAQNLLQLIGPAQHPGEWHLLVNRDGYYLKGRNAAEEWGFMYPDRRGHLFQADFPVVWRTISRQERGTLFTDQGLFIFTTIHPLRAGQISSSGMPLPVGASGAASGPEDFYWKLIVLVPPAEILPGQTGLLQKIATLVVPLWLSLVVASWFLAQARGKRHAAEIALRQAYDGLEQRVAERTRDLESARHRIEQILEAAGEGIYGTNAAGEVVFINATACRILGRPAEQLMGRNIHALVHYSGRDGTPLEPLECPIVRTLDSGEATMEGETVFWSAENRPIDVELTSKPILDGDRVAGAVVSFRDISEIKQTRDQMLRLATAIEQAGQGIMVMDADDVVLYANRAFLEDFEVEAEAILGQPLDRFPAIGPNLAELYDLLATVPRDVVRNQRLVLRGQSPEPVILELNLSPVFAADGSNIGHTLIHGNVTEQVNLERKLANSQKMEAIGTLAGGIAHDFNNILNAISGYTALAQSRLPAGHEAAGPLETVAQASRRAVSLVSQILAFSRKEESRQVPCDLGGITREALQMLRATLPATIKIVADSGPGDLWVRATPGQLHQVIMNLCTNAAQALKGLENGTINVELSRGSAAEAEGLEEGDYAVLRVRDNGTGIARDHLDRIFDPFLTTKGPGEGTGLGLAAVHGIVHACGGGITVSSEEGRGTEFGIFLPRCEPPAADSGAVETTAREVMNIPTGTGHILFVDDEEMLADLGREILEALGYQVTALTGSRAALDLFLDDPDKFDLVITDQSMPGMSGRALAGKIHARRPDIPIILCSGLPEELREGEQQDAVFSGFLQKPWGPGQMVSAIQAVSASSAAGGRPGPESGR